MNGTAKLVMGATLIMVVILAVVLPLILVLLAELYCSFLLRKRRFGTTTSMATTTTTPTTTSPQSSLCPPSGPFTSVYSQGVLLAPRSFLFPSITNKQEENQKEEIHKHQHQQHQTHYFPKKSDHQVLEIPTQDTKNIPNCIGLISASSPSPSSVSLAVSPQQPIQEVSIEVTNYSTSLGGGGGGGGGCGSSKEHFVYISNPIYDNEGCRNGNGEGIATPFETPDSSPSHLELEGYCSSEEDDESSSSSLSMTPPLTPMKKLLPMEDCSVSVSLRDARSIGNSRGSGSDSNNCISSSSSGSPSTSPSW